MLFRLNFLVIITTLVTDNDYILYYICAMHTFWFLSVYSMMYPFSQYNENKKVMVAKFFIYFVVIISLFNIPNMANVIFAPFYFLLKYESSLHEWIFRCKLDHCVTFVGMLCAYNHPTSEKILPLHQWSSLRESNSRMYISFAFSNIRSLVQKCIYFGKVRLQQASSLHVVYTDFDVHFLQKLDSLVTSTSFDDVCVFR